MDTKSKTTIALVAAAALTSATLAGVKILEEDLPLADTQKELTLEKEILAISLQGTKVYTSPVRVLDGGIEWRIVPPRCVRRPAGFKVTECMRAMVVDSKSVIVDFGELNRFPADAAVGLGCQPVACVDVWDEYSADEDEDEIIRRIKERANSK